ncbi:MULTISPECIES: prolipoprotein diacylglyceryl transferase [Prochlorococcus]|uniref:Phosphatidylglycerol--prolipoprotein diacylglyceryl transferase n=1 Tax=Prochlorococcus marinus (strain SARG / CCMP1375 / SS120) TaxID=167539 RepID=LGT_PROMA|nr:MULTISPECIES: prolipoprotein diacylglyceryl transferase [Prochlorococcus]Q7VDC2.1 RecName: Full=Phosphatidylglycerol--prolipoprotein diacylglyceryl transferase [Prochlorococcus marinus subsp. marinus str. CCMP1375]AAP99504.1 Prolipoprotein diacylglyceryltransferase [Prochlorococcus marinus subsp. marinus str. CCMP1375]KGG11224.1 Prolipoprotein diacylglyceryl transferase [Prochlorococcus marinus str. LG]KGG21562.1 Prolipoprotein diacylglyceryl transferase [Prochlorococcus marinus str. SS2]KG
MEGIIATFRSPGAELIELGTLTVRWYGILIAISVLIGLKLSTRLGSYRNINPGIINDLMPILILSSIFGARFYYVSFEWNNYNGVNFWSKVHLLGLQIPIPSFLEIWNGGIAIHGALIMGTISIILFCRIKKQRFWDVLDVLVPSVALGQAIGRWGNFFNNEAFGLPTNQPWKLFIPFSSRPESFSDQSYFHPTFLYESLWNICIFLILIFLFRLNIRGLMKLPSGALSCIYLITYSLGRIWIEGLRIDPLCLGGSPPFCEGGLRIAQLISFLLICLGSFGLWWIYQSKRKMPNFGITRNRKK